MAKGNRRGEKMLLVFVVTEDWYFYSHRRPMIRAAQESGFDVAVITNVDKHREKIEALGVRVLPFSFERRSLNPFLALKQIEALTALYRALDPALVHHIAMKPILFGSIAAWRAGVPSIVNAFAGLGYVFNADSLKATLLRLGLRPFFRVLLRRSNSWTLFQNKDDRETLAALGVIDPHRTRIIRGSGVDLDEYQVKPMSEPQPDFVCVFAGRMIGIKGLLTLREAFRLLGKRAPHIKLKLYGKPDPANPGSLSMDEIKAWVAEGNNVSYEGYARNMQDVWAAAHLAVQPSYGGEGIPKSLLEAAACGRPIIATDVPGCREMVVDWKSGLLVPPYDAAALADAIGVMAAHWKRCQTMGLESRALVEGDLSAESVTEQTAALYAECLARG